MSPNMIGIHTVLKNCYFLRTKVIFSARGRTLKVVHVCPFIVQMTGHILMMATALEGPKREGAFSGGPHRLTVFGL